MKLFSILALFCAALVWTGPLAAHGDEQHGKPPAQIGAAGENSGTVGAAGNTAAAETSSDEAAAGGHQASGADAADAGGRLEFLENLHPATVHFPIALFFMAALTELFVMRRTGGQFEPVVRVLVYGGAVGAVIAALFGWIHTGLWFGGDTTMQLHRWIGMAIALIGIVLAFLVSRAAHSRTSLRFGLFLIAIMVLVQGYLGGELAHGPGHLGITWL